MKARDIKWNTGGGNDPSTWEWSQTEKGKRHSNLHNVSVAVGHDPKLQALVWYDSFLDRLLTGPGREWTDADDVQVAIHLEQAYALTRITPSMVRDVINQRARFEPRHVVREYLQGLTWDQIPRIQDAFTDHWGAESGPDQPQEYLRAASANFFIGMVARVMRPGCKLDTMPVFEGPQGIYKSSALECLGGVWHIVSHESVTSKDFFQVLQGAWIVELSELDTISRAEVTRVKSVISTRVDRYRASYGRSAQDHPRQCVFAGTTNADNWGRDETGLRRFWPVKCGVINLTTLRAARDQLFAEAAILFDLKAPWWNMPTSTGQVQNDRQEESAWANLVLPFLLGKNEVRLADILTGPLKFDPSRINAGHERQLARVMRLLGWDRTTKRIDGEPTKVWLRASEIGNSLGHAIGNIDRDESF